MTSDPWLHHILMTAVNGFITLYQLMTSVVMRPLLATSTVIGWSPAVALGLRLYLHDISPPDSVADKTP